MRSLWLTTLLLLFSPTPVLGGDSCPSKGDLKLAEPHCELLKEPIFELDKVAVTAKEKCLCFYREAYAIVHLVKKYEADSESLAAEFSTKTSAENAGQADRSQSVVAYISQRAKEHHGKFANELEGKYALLKDYFDSYFQALNKLNQLGMRNVGSEISGFQRPESEIPALWSVSVANKQMKDLQRTYLGKDGKTGLNRGLRKIHHEARMAEESSGKMQNLTAARALGVGDASSIKAEDILNDPTTTMSSPHFVTRGAATVAGGATGLLLSGARVLPGAAGMTAAGVVEYIWYEKIDSGTLFAIGAGAIVGAAKGSVAGIVVSGGLSTLQYAGAKADALRHEYSEFSKSKILENRSIRAQPLSQAWIKYKSSTLQQQ